MKKNFEQSKKSKSSPKVNNFYKRKTNEKILEILKKKIGKISEIGFCSTKPFIHVSNYLTQ